MDEYDFGRHVWFAGVESSQDLYKKGYLSNIDSSSDFIRTLSTACHENPELKKAILTLLKIACTDSCSATLGILDGDIKGIDETNFLIDGNRISGVQEAFLELVCTELFPSYAKSNSDF